MKLSKLNTKITALEDICKPFVHKIEEVDKNEKDIDNLALRVKAFDEIIKECKEEVSAASEEHMEHVLKLLYGMEINEDESLDKYISQQIDNEYMEVNETKIKSLKMILANIEDVIDSLRLEYKNILHVNKEWYSFKSNKLKEYATFLKRLVALKESLEIQLEEDSKKISLSIIDDFYSLYIFFSFLIHLSIKKEKEILLIEIASKLDRYIEVIEPSFSDRFLHHNDMLYHYAIYEIKELKDKIFAFLK